jgi:AcrR family transcriptional regulator
MPEKISGEGRRQQEGPENGKRSPGRPRSEAARRAILRSTLRLLRTVGFAELSIEAIAADANVGKATVYRWWPNKGALVVDAFSSSVRKQLLFPDTGSVYSDMSLQMSHLVQLMLSRQGRIVAALIGGGQTDPELIDAFRERFVRPRRKEAYQTLRKGIDRGELPADADLDLILDSLYGAIYMRFLIWKAGLNDAFIEDICQMVLDGAARRRLSRVDRNPTLRNGVLTV